jgi:phosphohistidine phosphatase
MPVPGGPAGHTGAVTPAGHGHQLWLLRHAKTVADPPPGGSDHDRVLAPRGRRDADQLGRRLGDDPPALGLVGGLRPELVLCSTARRTVQTAERVLAPLTDPPPLELVDALYGASPAEVLDQVRLVDETVRSVMVVGHNPTARDLAGDLLAGDDRDGLRQIERRGFPTCALAVYQLPAARWTDVAMGSATLLGLFTPPF